MKVYNQDKTELLNETELDFNIGQLVEDKIVVAHHEATEFIPAKTVEQQLAELGDSDVKVKEIKGKYYRIVHTYDNGGEDCEEITEIPAIPAKEAYDDYENIQVYVPYTADELQSIANNKRHAELKAELAKIKEDIEQENFGIVRDDFTEKKARAAEIINELRVLEGKAPRAVRPSVL